MAQPIAAIFLRRLTASRNDASEPRSILVRAPRRRTPRPAVEHAHDPMDDIRRGDRLARAGRVTEARTSYRRAAEAFARAGRAAHARAACRRALELAPDDRAAKELLVAIEVPAAEITAPPTARDVPAARREPAPAPLPRRPAPTFDPARASLGLLPLEEGEELVSADDFCPATGRTLSVPAIEVDALQARRAERRRAAAAAAESSEDEIDEIWVDLSGLDD